MPSYECYECNWRKMKNCHPWSLIEERKKFGELKRSIQGVTQKMLTQQLRELERDGIVHREIYKEIPPKVEYSLTDFEKSLEPIVNQLWSFGEEIIENNK